MSSLRDTLLAKQRAFTVGRTNDMVNIKDSGQQGYAPDLTTINSNASYVRRNLVCLLIQAPKGFQDLPEPRDWVESLKELVERHPTRIEGLRSTVNVEWYESPVNGAGEMQQDIANITRERSEPSFTWPEKYGKPIRTFLEGWIANLMGDANNKIPMVVTRGLLRNKRIQLLPEYTGAIMLFMELDPTHTQVVEAWLCTNMMPNTTGPIEGSRDITAGGEGVEINVTFSAITQVGYGVRSYAQRIVDAMDLTGANPDLAPPLIDKIDAMVQAAQTGYLHQIEEAGNTYERP